MQYFQKLIQKDLGFGYSLDTSIPYAPTLWSLHHGKAKDTSDPVLVFHHDPTKNSSNQTPIKSALTRLKTLRHPDILKYISSVEGSDGTVYISTEPATPLSALLSSSTKESHRDTILWGLFTISRALGFLHDSGLIHARLNPSSVFVTPNGDWKLAGFECVTPHSSSSMLSQGKSMQLDTYQSPEFSRSNWSAVASASASAVDSWALGCLMYEAHAGSFTSADQLQNMAAIPKPLLSAYQKLLASNPANRAPAGQLPSHPHFQSSKFVELNMFVENLALKGQLEREAFLGKLPSIMDRLPDGFCTYKILPMLSQSIESGAGGSAAFACVVKMKGRLSEEEFAERVVKKYAVGWYSNQNLDRNLKTELFNNLELFTTHMDDGALNSQLFPAMCAAFQDMQAPALRDASVKSVLIVCDRLTEKNLNSVLMSHFARLQVDPEPAIRTNTTVCLGKLAPRLSQAARNKVLAAAFLRALKDPFPHARAAGVNAILSTTDSYQLKEVATRILPAVVPLLVDGSGDVRKLAFKVLVAFEKRLERNHEEMSRVEETTGGQQGMDGNAGMGKGSTSGTSGWGLSSFSSMTAALLNNKSEATARASTSTGISSEDFKKGRPKGSVGSQPFGEANGKSGSGVNPKPVVVSSDSWSSMNGNSGMSMSSGAPAAFSETPLIANSSGDASGGFGVFNDGGNGEVLDDDGDDGWGDMDIKSNTAQKEGNEEDLFVAMMGKPSSKTGTIPGGMSRSNSNASNGSKASGGDLWDLAPPLVSKPKPKPPLPRSVGVGGRGMGAGSGSIRRNKKSTGDDWEALLGGTGGSSKRRTAGRGSGR